MATPDLVEAGQMNAQSVCVTDRNHRPKSKQENPTDWSSPVTANRFGAPACAPKKAEKARFELEKERRDYDFDMQK